MMKQLIKNFINDVLKFDIKLLKKGCGYEFERFSYQFKHINFDIHQGEKVLDIGSGQDPFPLATHLADLYLGDTTHRFRPLKIDNRPFIVCNIGAMPFADKAFDFLYCSHVLEHTEDPARACDELMRIGKRGYIETPTKTSDILFNFIRLPFHHRWHIEVLGDTIIFLEWKNSELIGLGTNYFFEQFQSKWTNPIQETIHNNRSLFMNMMLWHTRFDYLVISKDGKILNSTL
ncbi:MAG: methyltransferase domain-containing protein [Candidatus Brocadia sp.]|jgi:Methylase involved in ubiquinone/menaquinone biosynthesis|uniref:Methyltransferase n=1 Tax=Candidatus Brocadia fulgida TaxID=380242 RepID=A0A0M2UQF8_9BACT|nr:MAG: putative methyltransferase [Candidatus Brocadia fulgida]UJS20231.1 MAG: methyltransferase domain-containing protein [Candidatus Brocadia sp.]